MHTIFSSDSLRFLRLFNGLSFFFELSIYQSETINKIAQIPKEASFRFTLKSSNWNKDGQINYTVTVFGVLCDDFEAQFVYCPYRKVLKSGSIPSCPSTSSRRKRMFAEDESCLIWPLLCF
ncbi:hypothetical protein CAEBREN_05746 [Caenorhabditis brenneri]|uniref:NTF2-like domain-containing protein n=1 Tax=Caenorhabditis brenneri TaxID=135651 RepID=G0NNS5_CAEBE|nr:hypothetical protein CAEBREN_05746 [Caenorhabditis brenneri]